MATTNINTNTNRFLSSSASSSPTFQNMVFKSEEHRPLSPEKLQNNNNNNGQHKVICTPEVSLYQNDLMAASTITNKQMTDIETGRIVSPISRANNNITNGTNNNGFQCGFCGKTFQQKNTFQNHLRSHRDVNGPDAYQCDICNKTFAVPARLTRHYRTHTGEKPYQCEYCNKSFSVKENLSVHRRIHTKERPYKCEVCERAFEHSGKLHRHMRIHTGERPHQCQVCQKTFIQSGQLVIHMRTHTGEKPYVCKVCNKGFTCSKQLKVHTRTHTGEKPYSCEICGKSFGYNHVLKLHQVAHYGEKVYKCTICNSTFNSKKSLETHIKTHSDSSSTIDSDIAVVPEQRIVHSPSSMTSLTPVNSDKENRELSDSDLSSLSQTSNSPIDSPPRSPSEANNNSVYILPTNSPPPGHQNARNGQNGGSSIPNLPYPMLPPSVQVHQAPQSRTTFLYVTSKLPQPSANNNGNNSSTSPDQVIPTAKASSSNLNFKTFSFNDNRVKASLDERDKHFLQNASIRDKVLASIEKFGYGLNSSENGMDYPRTVANNNSSNSHQLYSLNQQQRKHTERTENFINRSSFPENLTFNKYNSNNFIGKSHKMNNNDHYFSPYSRQNASRSVAMMREQQQQKSVISAVHNNNQMETNSNPDEQFDRLKSMYPSGGVLALALTRGSKVAASQLPHSISMTPIPTARNHQNSFYNASSNYHVSSSPRSQSPQELCIDFSRRQPQQVVRSESVSPSPPPRHLSPTGSLGQSEGSDDMSDECQEKPRNRPSLGSGPRKRSSLILEKYAQETVPPPSSPVSPKSESILSQRLRLSSVIQYAEKCT